MSKFEQQRSDHTSCFAFLVYDNLCHWCSHKAFSTCFFNGRDEMKCNLTGSSSWIVTTPHEMCHQWSLHKEWTLIWWGTWGQKENKSCQLWICKNINNKNVFLDQTYTCNSKLLIIIYKANYNYMFAKWKLKLLVITTQSLI